MHDAKIMIIEDEAIIAKDIENILLNYGYEITGIYSRAEDAIESLKSSKPDLILMDVVLKGDIDGIEAARIIKKTMRIPIIFITAYADDTTISRIKKTEPYGYFLKPFEEKELQTWIETTLQKFDSEEIHKKKERLAFSILESMDNSIIAADRHGKVTYINSSAEKLTGWKNDEAIGEQLGKIINIADLDSKFDYLQSLNVTGESSHDNIKINNKNNEAKEITYSLIPLRENENIKGYMLSIRESTQLEKTEELGKKLEDSYKEIEKFAYIASHDLQEPLRMVASYVQLLKKRYVSKLDAEAEEFIDFAVSGANRMKLLIDDLLLYSRINTKRMSPSEINCSKIVNDISNKIKQEWLELKPEIKYSGLPVLYGDAFQMQQLFYHLLTNAVKFNTNTQQIVEISCRQQDGYWLFSVTDNGIGIDKQYYEKIFEAFQKLHNSKDYPGTGIGLAVCKKIVDLHGGKIWVESEKGKGAVFYFTIKNKKIKKEING